MTNLPPVGVGLGTTADKLLLERAHLDGEWRSAYTANEAAIAALRAAEQADRKAYAQALRQPEGTDPGKAKTEQAQRSLERSEARLLACRDAEQANTAELQGVLREEADEIRANLAEVAEQTRGEALTQLELLSKTLHTWSDITALLDWADSPTKGETLRVWSPVAFRVDVSGLQSAESSHVGVDRVLAVVGRRLETSAAFSDHEVRAAARDAGLVCSSIVRQDRGAAKFGTPPISVLDIRDHGLSKVVFARRGLSVSALVATTTLEAVDLPSFVRRIAPQVAARFNGTTKGQVVADDQATQEIVKSAFTDLSRQADVADRTELPDGSVVENRAEQHHLREQTERRAAEAATR
jgi:hypothetical protein